MKYTQPDNNTERPAKKPFPVKYILCVLLALSLIVNIILLCGPDSSSQIEGSGFSSPEAAILEYAHAFQAGDVDRMIASFAVESYVERHDLVARTEYWGYYLFDGNDILLPNTNEYAQQLNCHSRVASITDYIHRGYFTLAGVDNSINNLSFSRRDPEFDSRIADFVQQLGFPDFDQKRAHMEIGKVLTGKDFGIDPSVANNTSKVYAHCGFDEVCDVAVEITFDGQEYYLFMATARIGNRWYNLTPICQLALSNGADGQTGGFLKR